MLRFLLFIGMAMGFAHASFAFQAPVHNYLVSIDQKAKRAHVEADIQLEGHQLALFNVNPMPQFPNGQADFIENLMVKNAQGKILTLKNKGEGEFELEGNQAIHVSYDVRLEHDQLQWPAGNEEVLYHTDEGVMMTGYALFLVPGEKMSGTTRVEFQLPIGWRANTAMEAQAQANVYIAKSRRELVNNAMFFGAAQSYQVNAGGIKLSLVLGKRYWAQREMFKDLLDKQLRTYLKLFGSKPSAERYLIIINQGDSGDGGAFSGSFSQFLRGDAELRTRSIWGRVLAHELLHFWNGLSLTPKDESEEWFKEGVTDYLTIVTMANNHFLDRSYVQQWLENLSRGQTVARRAQGLTGSVREAAKNKHQNWLLVYGGGSIAGLALDLELRRVSNNQVTIHHLMQTLFKDFALQGKAYSYADIQIKAQQLTGKNFEKKLDDLVNNRNMLELNPLFEALGLRLEQYLLLEHMLLVDDKASKENKRRFKDIFGQNF